ncbi:MAG: NTP transferase domain-containing protein [Deltaproteobacteria bacterium]|nr:NTP transferase domain-containing protein [Deltaproteobacteria bacterium]
MKAVILAGGKGRRLRPFSVIFPKPLAPIGDRPVIEHLIRYLARYGVTRVTLCVDYLSELLRAFLDSRAELRRMVEVEYVRDEQPGGTAGPIAAVAGLDSTFLVTNGDLVTDLDLAAMLAHHRAAGAVLTIAAYERRTQLPYGLIEADERGIVRGYREKPTLSNEVSMGVYLYEPAVLRHIPRGVYLDFPQLVLKLLAAGERVARFPWSGYWMDIGNPDDYAQAQDDCAAGVGPWAGCDGGGRGP